MNENKLIIKYLKTLSNEQIFKIAQLCVEELILTEEVRFQKAEEDYSFDIVKEHLYWVNSGENLLDTD